MNPDTEHAERQGIRFFGRVAASISHELKNVLAIINENAGLLGDYASLADKGSTVDSARLARVARQLDQQVQRADAIVKNLHRLAHSTDTTLASIDLHELMLLLAALHAPLAKVRGVTLEIHPAATAALADNDPFLLETLAGACLEFALHHPAGDRIEVAVSAGTDESQVCFAPLSDAATGFPKPEVQLLANRLGATIQLTAGNGGLLLILPRATMVPA